VDRLPHGKAFATLALTSPCPSACPTAFFAIPKQLSNAAMPLPKRDHANAPDRIRTCDLRSRRLEIWRLLEPPAAILCQTRYLTVGQRRAKAKAFLDERPELVEALAAEARDVPEVGA
jgi:hypothetical protein